MSDGAIGPPPSESAKPNPDRLSNHFRSCTQRRGHHMSTAIAESRHTVDTMRRIELTQWGVENLLTTSVPCPEPGPGQVLVQVEAIALNYRDLLVIAGLYNPKMA